MKSIFFLILVWAAPAFADSGLLYLSDQNERTIFSDQITVAPALANGVQGFHFSILDPQNSWDLELGAPVAQKLAVQLYREAVSLRRGATSQPDFSIAGGWITCVPTTSSFQVLELKEAAGKLSQLAVNFIQNCDDGNRLRGAFRFNSSLPIAKPIVIATTPATPDNGPGLGLGSVFYFSSPVGDHVGNGQTFRLTEKDGNFSAVNDRGEIAVHYSQCCGIHWDLEMSAPSGQPLTVNRYLAAIDILFHDRKNPGLAFSGNGNSCKWLMGSFEIFELEYSAQDPKIVTRLAADFTQSCEFGPAGHGAIRFNSGLPILTP